MKNPLTFLCISNYFKGSDFLIQLKELGNTVYLVTSETLRDKPWPHQHIDEIYYMSGHDTDWNLDHLCLGVCGILRNKKIDVVVALDDFDVEKAAFLRENLRIPGMGLTTSRYFRDKLAMRMKAHEASISIPAFCALFNDQTINEFAAKVEFPYVLKPRSEASSHGIVKVNSKEELWHHINELGDNRFKYLVEQFRPGSVFHVDTLVNDDKVLFSCVSQYLSTPMEITHGGGIFRSVTVEYDSEDWTNLEELNKKLLKAFGIRFGASHSEFIKGNDGNYYFLETASRVGGAHLAEMVEAASGINLWKEWAKLEDANHKNLKYKLPKIKKEFSGIINTLSKYQHPDLSSFDDKEIYWKLPLEYHAGLIVHAKKRSRIMELLDDYMRRLSDNFHTTMEPEKVKNFH